MEEPAVQAGKYSRCSQSRLTLNKNDLMRDGRSNSISDPASPSATRRWIVSRCCRWRAIGDNSRSRCYNDSTDWRSPLRLLQHRYNWLFGPGKGPWPASHMATSRSCAVKAKSESDMIGQADSFHRRWIAMIDVLPSRPIVAVTINISGRFHCGHGS